MVEGRKGSNVAGHQNQRPKRRRLNSDTHQSPKPNSTPTRTSLRLARRRSPGKKSSGIDWETELPNATAALDKALSKITSRRGVETRDLCDEIADYLTQALFEDVWRCRAAHSFMQDPNSQPAGSALKSEPQEDRENIEPNAKASDKGKVTLPIPKSAPVAERDAEDPATPAATSYRRTQKRKRKPSSRKSKPRKSGQEEKGEDENDKAANIYPRTRKETLVQKEGPSGNDFETPQHVNRDEVLVEEVIEIEEDFVDGGIAFDRSKTLEGDIEEQVLDRSGSGSRSVPNSEGKDATPSVGTGKRRHRSKTLLGHVEEQVLDRSGDKFAPNSEVKNAASRDGSSRRLPWWCVSDDRLEAISKSETEVLRSYVTAIFRTCIRESWNAETLRESYTRDPRSNRGQAFRSVHESLHLLERARHVKECESRWRPELLRELLQRQEMDWSIVKHDKKFDQFIGCDACLGHRQATARIWLKGTRYDASDFWPGASRFRVVSSEQISDRKLLVSAELRNGSTNDHLIRIGANENDTEFWVDPHCLRKCLLFHELVHSTATIARDFRRIIERELGNGTVELKLSSREMPSRSGASVSERLERFLLRSILHDKEYVRNHVDHLIDIIRLGDVYFSSPDAEVLDSGKLGKSVYVPNIYDAPLDLGDEEYRQRIDEVVARSRRKRQAKPTS